MNKKTIGNFDISIVSFYRTQQLTNIVRNISLNKILDLELNCIPLWQTHL